MNDFLDALRFPGAYLKPPSERPAKSWSAWTGTSSSSPESRSRWQQQDCYLRWRSLIEPSIRQAIHGSPGPRRARSA